MVMIEKIVRDELNTRVWTFTEIADVSTTVELLTQIVYDKIPTKDKLEIVWDVEVFSEEKIYFGELYSRTIMSELRVMVADIVKDELSLAKIVFNKNKEDEKDDISKGSLGGKPLKERTADEKKDSEE